MKKKMLTILTVGALLAQSSGVYAMRKASGERDPEGRPSRFQQVGNFLTGFAAAITQGGVDSFSDMKDWLKDHKKTSGVVIGVLIVAILAALKAKDIKSVLKPRERAGVIMNFVMQLARDIQTRGIRTAGQLRDLLMGYKKTTASVVIGSVIGALLVALGLKIRRAQIRQKQLEQIF